MLFKKSVGMFERIAAGRTDLVFEYVAEGNAATAGLHTSVVSQK